VILGGGTGGTMTANRLRRRFDADEAEIRVVDRDDWHVYQPGLLFVPFGLTRVEEIVRPRQRQLRSGIVFHENEVAEAWVDRDEVLLDDGTVLPYDVPVVATGVRLQPEETEGLTGPGWNERVFTFYTPEGADALRCALERFDGGRLVVNLVDTPIKCPVAPLEFAFLADWYLRERGIRNRTKLVYSTPLDGDFRRTWAKARGSNHRPRHHACDRPHHVGELANDLDYGPRRDARRARAVTKHKRRIPRISRSQTSGPRPA
jgi:sulfide:quinone oxidoreductase